MTTYARCAGVFCDKSCGATGGEQCRLTVSLAAADAASKSEPATAWVFLHRRPMDKQAWPVIYTDHGLALKCKFRVSDLVPVSLPAEQAGPLEQSKETIDD